MSENKINQTGTKQVLIVDNNTDLLMSIKEGLGRFRSQFSVLLAGDGKKALDILKKESISVVVSDVKMPKMNGLELLLNITNEYPDIPVIIMTAYGREELEWMARRSGAVAFIGKPFSMRDLSTKLLSLLKQESDGGVINSIAVGVFMQLAEMEEMTCTIRVRSDINSTTGVVFFKEGQLMDARYGSKVGEDAIFMIMALEQAKIEIQNSCSATVQARIGMGLQAVLLEAMRLKDELASDESEKNDEVRAVKESISPPQPPAARPAKKVPVRKKKPTAKRILQAIQKKIGKKIGIGQIYADRDWEHTVTLALKVGGFFNAGPLQCGYISRTNEDPVFFIPGSPSALMKVDRMSPRDRMFNIARQLK